jgi:hypothetical protein
MVAKPTQAIRNIYDGCRLIETCHPGVSPRKRSARGDQGARGGLECAASNVSSVRQTTAGVAGFSMRIMFA